MFEVDVQYRYSTSIDDATRDYTTDLYPWNRAFSYGPSGFDTTHNYKIWGLFTPRFTQTGHSFIDKVLGGWTISGIIQWAFRIPVVPASTSSGGTVEYPGSGIGCIFPLSYAGDATNSFR